MTAIKESIREAWAYRLRPSLPSFLNIALARLTGALGMDTRLLHWLIPGCRRSGFVSLTPATPPALYSCLRRVAEAGLRGDYYEFGLYRGYTFWFAQQAAAILGLHRMRFFGFDSFRGLPPLRDTAEGKEFQEGDYACDRDTVAGLLSRFGVDWSRTHLIEGFYDVSLKSDLPGDTQGHAVAIALIDCDLYTSTVPVLDFLEGRLQEGAILLFDDWNCFGKSDEHGERRAFREFLDRYPRWAADPLFAFGWHGQAFALHTLPPAGHVPPTGAGYSYGETG
jgi:O-methyltransferase